MQLKIIIGKLLENYANIPYEFGISQCNDADGVHARIISMHRRDKSSSCCCYLCEIRPAENYKDRARSGYRCVCSFFSSHAHAVAAAQKNKSEKSLLLRYMTWLHTRHTARRERERARAARAGVNVPCHLLRIKLYIPIRSARRAYKSRSFATAISTAVLPKCEREGEVVRANYFRLRAGTARRTRRSIDLFMRRRFLFSLGFRVIMRSGA